MYLSFLCKKVSFFVQNKIRAKAWRTAVSESLLFDPIIVAREKGVRWRCAIDEKKTSMKNAFFFVFRAERIHCNGRTTINFTNSVKKLYRSHTSMK